MNNHIHLFYYAALSADAIFHAELKAACGRNAVLHRFEFEERLFPYDTPAVAVARMQFHECTRASHLATLQWRKVG